MLWESGPFTSFFRLRGLTLDGMYRRAPDASGTTSVRPHAESPSFQRSAGLSLIEAWPASEKCAKENR